MNGYKWSATTVNFFPKSWLSSYESAGWDMSDMIDISDDIVSTFTGSPPPGKALGADDGMPVWVDMPPPTRKELIAAADVKKQALISQANDYMSSRQWPGKAAIGRLKGDELAQYNLWLDYLDALEALGISTAPDIEWPVQPQ
ncbi:tail fiber assembly protein [Escherichia coli]|uniref:tail fiber assembly protein n=1 Tax=Escherichia coli TaxID=562 RepID=UPI0002CB4640|nr:tail fiber assembly protein [Escherichia coli]EAB6055359.1 tail fiber assembly protein [Escherichia coli]EEV5827948.1 tail fiber assembly protein [Escherichia coli]EEV6729675.1 tail fiber assembly protein [Escherichia coli]EFB7424400.1 tail fiber assembly protein [Escherichia coli]EFB9399089.1 tail fiber assembly protein [Escherichia coli]